MGGVGLICRIVADGDGLGNRILASDYAADLGLVMRPFAPMQKATFALFSHFLTTWHERETVAPVPSQLIKLDCEEI